MPKAKKQYLLCPFCEATSTRGTGLSAHVRARHSKQYKTWNRNPNRLVEAAEAAQGRIAQSSEGPELEVATVYLVPETSSEVVEQSMAAIPVMNGGSGEAALDLLQKVHDQLAARKHNIEAEMARVEALRSEHESVITQLAAIDQAMVAFRH